MVSIPFYHVARDVIGFLRSLQPATKLPGGDAGREEKVNSPFFEIALVLVRLDHVAGFIVLFDLFVQNRIIVANEGPELTSLPTSSCIK
jgi:hypothetical protein